MKNDVIKILKDQDITPNEKFNALLAIFLKTPTHGKSQARFYNKRLYTPQTLESLVYDVKKLFAIRDLDLVGKIVALQPKKTKQEHLLELDLTDKTAEEKAVIVAQYAQESGFTDMDVMVVPEFTKGRDGTEEMKAWLTEQGVTFTANNKKELGNLINETTAAHADQLFSIAFSNLEEFQANQATDALAAQQAAEAATKAKEEVNDPAKQKAAVIALIEAADDTVKGGAKIREEFPFLRDDDCPDELKVLVADKITAFENFRNNREELKALIAEGKEDILFEAAAAAVENFELNLEIYDELNYYAEHKEILGKHPIFADLMLQRKVDAYKTVDLVKNRNNLRSGVSQQKGKLEKLAKNADTSGIDAIIADKEKEIALIQVRIDAND